MASPGVHPATSYREHPSPQRGPGDMKLVEATMDVRAEGTLVWTHRGPDGTETTMTGTFVELDAPHRFVHREDWGPGLPSPLIETTCEEVGGQTLVTVRFTLPSAGTRVHVVADGAMAECFRISHHTLDELLPTLS